MPYYCVTDLIEPVDSIQSQSRVDNVVFFIMDLCPVYVEYDRQNENEGPVEVVSAANLYSIHQILSSLGPVSPEHKMHYYASPLLGYRLEKALVSSI